MLYCLYRDSFNVQGFFIVLIVDYVKVICLEVLVMVIFYFVFVGFFYVDVKGSLCKYSLYYLFLRFQEFFCIQLRGRCDCFEEFKYLV